MRVLGAAVFGLVMMSSVAPAVSGEAADAIYVGGDIVTINDNHRRG